MGEFFEEELVAPDAIADSLFARAKTAYTNQKEESCDDVCTYRDFIRLEREISSLREEVRSLISLKEPVEEAEEAE